MQKKKDNVVVFYLNYKHLQTKFDWVSVAVEAADKSRFSVIYKLATGKYKTINGSFSGVDERFTFNF